MAARITWVSKIKAGDFVGASWLEGIGMKAINQDQQKLAGVALESFDESESDSIKVDRMFSSNSS